MKRYFILLSLCLLASYQAQSQVLISLLFGDKLNSEYIEFGLDGGADFSSLEGISSNMGPNFYLGFYFDMNIKKSPDWIFNTGVIVKSTMGAEDIAVYSLNNPDLDAAFEGGSVQRKINYFNVPLVIKRKFGDRFYLGAGTMLGLRYKAHDLFTNRVIDKEDLSYKLDIKDQTTALDAGLMGSINYKLMSKMGMNINLKYYYGLVNINKNPVEGKQYNRSIYLGVGIPIGSGKNKKHQDVETAPHGETN
ncbi:outer membrane beta-barrel protein [Xanthomarina sp. F2636L]|uniref:outer membrane beta-barrel protein n=1 Tax=Xanthomarina sp. F2636L TaxID=2996018 RepID=UPI00225E2253|nr:outer membrane beta-barrel protein [Xanthomarina sp. F2636L]MCX7549399.1 outer membrane beta-barrel protein [Xanthomarina sp. F2636L]